MGIYINPKNESKEQWLNKSAKSVSLDELHLADYQTTFPVVLVNNGFFTAAAVADTPKELNRFVGYPDDRPMKYFLVTIDKLKTVLDEYELTILSGG